MMMMMMINDVSTVTVCQQQMITSTVLERFCRMFEVLWQKWQSLVEELPVKCATSTLILGTVSKVLVVDNVNERTHNGPVVLGYWLYSTTPAALLNQSIVSKI